MFDLREIASIANEQNSLTKMVNHITTQQINTTQFCTQSLREGKEKPNRIRSKSETKKLFFVEKSKENPYSCGKYPFHKINIKPKTLLIDMRQM